MADLKAQIEARHEKFMTFYKARDAKGMASLYTEDCRFLPPGLDAHYGREGAEKLFVDEWAAGGKTMELKVEEVGPMGSDVIYERASFTTKCDDGSVFEAGKSLAIWKKVGGEWLIDIDIYNINK
ncbi:uncharacterized protein [Branchiostoma lanceolatum]|uniref:Hypp1046 protein n=1 Tax=Branchiostoma lanceolatum TaxID=7740 RepID=A0A8J9ZEH6_BRALA|nr:Hypp1046 [Branchiostoma lanceolatum]